MTRRTQGQAAKRIARIECELDGAQTIQAANDFAEAERSAGRLARVHTRIVRAEGCSARVHVVVVEDPS